MSSGLRGMDVDAGDQAWRVLDIGGDELVQLETRLNQTLNGFEWFGDDARRCRDEWNSTYRTALHQAANAIKEYANAINNEVQQQRAASN